MKQIASGKMLKSGKVGVWLLGGGLTAGAYHWYRQTTQVSSQKSFIEQALLPIRNTASTSQQEVVFNDIGGNPKRQNLPGKGSSIGTKVRFCIDQYMTNMLEQTLLQYSLCECRLILDYYSLMLPSLAHGDGPSIAQEFWRLCRNTSSHQCSIFVQESGTLF